MAVNRPPPETNLFARHMDRIDTTVENRAIKHAEQVVWATIEQQQIDLDRVFYSTFSRDGATGWALRLTDDPLTEDVGRPRHEAP